MCVVAGGGPSSERTKANEIDQTLIFFVFFGSRGFVVLGLRAPFPFAARVAGLGPGVDLPERVPLSGASVHQVHGRGFPDRRPGGHHVKGGA